MSTFKADLAAAARRHHKCGDVLAKSGDHAEAGYLFGLAAECAVKAVAEEVP